MNPIAYTNNPKLKTVLPADEWKGTAIYPHNKFDNVYQKFSLSFWDIIQWKFSKNKLSKIKKAEHWNPEIIKDDSWLNRNNNCMVWLGHASFFIRINGVNILIDPVLDNAGISKRHSSFPIDKTKLKGIDYILLSHDHRDHIDKSSLRLLAKQNPNAHYCAGLRTEKLLNAITHSANIETAGWYQQFTTDTSKIELYFLPTRHWGKRGLFDTRKRLWGAFVIKGGGKTIYVGGDSGYDQHYKDAKRVFGHFDYCILGIGAYLPLKVMHTNHNSPTDALQAFTDLGADKFIPMHYGTFDLSDEPLSYPITELHTLAKEKNIDTAIQELHYGECLTF